jgi:hypothetical protein
MNNKTIWLTANQAIAMLERHGHTLTYKSFMTLICRGKLHARKKRHPRNGHITLYHRGDLLNSITRPDENALREQGYVDIKELFDHDARLRRRNMLPARASLNSMRGWIRTHQNKIRVETINAKKNLYHLESVLDALTDTYTENPHVEKCRANTNASIRASHLEATPAILNNQDYQPMDFIRACGINPQRVIRMVREKTILPFWDSANNRLLYPVQEIITRANHHLLKTIRTRLGSKYADHIKATRPFIEWMSPLGKRKAYYAPELAHL